jgi:mRNA-degrading endonuclease toxin of MazEF toxin-antitoxin module
MSSPQQYQRGDVLLADLPFADVVRSKVRPVLVVQNDVANRLRENLIVVAFSSRVPSRPLPTQYRVEVGSQLAQRAGLVRDCVVDCGVIHTIAKSRIRRKIGSFISEAMSEIDHCLRISLALT